MTREDFEKMGFDLSKPTMEDKLRELGIRINHKEFSEDETKYFLSLNFMPNEEKAAIINDSKWQGEFLVKIANNWMKKFPDVLDPELFLFGIICFGIDNPGKLNVLVAKCLEHYLKVGRKIVPDDLSMEIFPFGMYDDDTFRNIIDKCMKPKASLFSEIY